MNLYIDNNKSIRSFITVTDVAKTYKEIMNSNTTPYIRYDSDWVIVWNGKDVKLKNRILIIQKM